MARRIFWVVLVAGCSFTGGLAGLLVTSWGELPAWAQPPGRDSTPPVVTDLVTLGERFELVASKVSPAVVYVEAKKPNEKVAPGSKRLVEESGSGVIINWPGRREPLVLTNNHVVAGTEPERMVVHLADGRVFRPGKAWSDPESDVAVLSLGDQGNLSGTLPAATLGNSDRMQVGNWVLAIGSPFGLNQTVTHGIISARDRGQISLGSTIRIKEFLQTDAAINPGSSGGPLLNLDGEVIGINTAIASPNGSNSGIAFSIPANLVRRVVGQLLDKGAVLRGYLGIQLAPALEPADVLKRGLDQATGAFVEAVYPDTPGSAAGLHVGDLIVALDHTSIRNENQLINLISATQPGKTVSLGVVRDGKRQTLTAVVGDWAEGQNRLRQR